MLATSLQRLSFFRLSGQFCPILCVNTTIQYCRMNPQCWNMRNLGKMPLCELFEGVPTHSRRIFFQLLSAEEQVFLASGVLYSAITPLHSVKCPRSYPVAFLIELKHPRNCSCMISDNLPRKWRTAEDALNLVLYFVVLSRQKQG